jgi:hypothetical protein
MVLGMDVDQQFGKRMAAGGWGRRILTALIALAALGGFAVVVVYSYDRGTELASQETAPIIKAREGPTRIRPEQPGGMAIPNQDKQIYARLGGKPDKAKVERLLPPPEPVVTKPPPLPKVKIPVVLKSAAPSLPLAQAATGHAKADITPKELDAISPNAAPPPKQVKAPAKAVRVATPPPAKTAASQMAKIVEDARNSAQPTKGWRVQIASLRSEAAGNSTWVSLRKKHSDLFGKLSMRLVKADIKGRGIFYRLQAEPVADKAAASGLCQKARVRKIGCLIVRP